MIYRLKEIPIKIPVKFVTELEHVVLKFALWKCKGFWTAKAMLNKKIARHGFKMYDSCLPKHHDNTIKTDPLMSGTESELLGMNSCSWLVLNKSIKNLREKALPLQSIALETWVPMCARLKPLSPFLALLYKTELRLAQRIEDWDYETTRRKRRENTSGHWQSRDPQTEQNADEILGF